MEFKLGEKYKSHALWDYEKTGKYDIFEVVMHDGEISFLNHTDGVIFDLGFLGSSDLVRI